MNKTAVVCAAIVAAMAALTAPAGAQAADYTVKAGDTLWGLATKHRMSVTELMKVNGLSSTSLRIGQRLTLPDAGNYVVQAGDTLTKIAARSGIPLQTLIRANPQLANPNQIWPGLKLTIPPPPNRFRDGYFPLSLGTYTPFTDNYADARSWSPGGPAPRTHEGVDVFAAEGTPVYAAATGTILNVGWNEYGGYRLTVRVDAKTAFYYAHLSKYSRPFAIGGAIAKGQLIGYVGSTGYGPEGTKGLFAPHLHFGIYDTSASPWTTINPHPYLTWWELLR